MCVCDSWTEQNTHQMQFVFFLLKIGVLYFPRLIHIRSFHLIMMKIYWMCRKNQAARQADDLNEWNWCFACLSALSTKFIYIYIQHFMSTVVCLSVRKCCAVDAKINNWLNEVTVSGGEKPEMRNACDDTGTNCNSNSWPHICKSENTTALAGGSGGSGGGGGGGRKKWPTPIAEYDARFIRCTFRILIDPVVLRCCCWLLFAEEANCVIGSWVFTVHCAGTVCAQLSIMQPFTYVCKIFKFGL